jgi:hypothetical protein
LRHAITSLKVYVKLGVPLRFTCCARLEGLNTQQIAQEEAAKAHTHRQAALDSEYCRTYGQWQARLGKTKESDYGSRF